MAGLMHSLWISLNSFNDTSQHSTDMAFHTVMGRVWDVRGTSAWQQFPSLWFISMDSVILGKRESSSLLLTNRCSRVRNLRFLYACERRGDDSTEKSHYSVYNPGFTEAKAVSFQSTKQSSSSQSKLAHKFPLSFAEHNHF